MSIPVLAIPVINRADLLARCIRSIDYPVDEILVINNGRDVAVASILRQLSDEYAVLSVHKPAENLGVSGSWNWAMHNRPKAEYWLHVGNDIQFTPGDLRLIDEGVRRHPEMVVRPANWGHSIFAVRPHCLTTAGDFDQNFVPAYLEDSDHMYRINLLGLPWADIGKAQDEHEECRAIHGEAPTWGSHAIYADRRLLEANRTTHGNNFRYYVRKWGGGPGEEKFTHPFDDPDWPVSKWVPDAEHLKANRIFNDIISRI